MKRIGITGQKGFIGSHLFNSLQLFPNEFECVPFEDVYFEKDETLYQFVAQCDVIVHLAAVNRHENQQVLYDTNVALTQKLVAALKKTESKAHVFISSSTQEEHENLYGKSKRVARELLNDWAKNYGGRATGLIIPNVFGAFGKPFYNSFIATFCYQLTHGQSPIIATDAQVNLIYVHELTSLIINEIRTEKGTSALYVSHTSTQKVSEVLALLQSFANSYLEKGEIPILINAFEYNLFNTFRSYIDHKSHFPVKLTQHNDTRGTFVEVIRLGIGGQCSFSTTHPHITRGNHYHTRKIERFTVIKGKALIQLRKIDTQEVLEFYLDGSEPAYVDMPIWYTHNITNIGEDDLYTIFWINEPYKPDNADTYFLEV